MFLIVLLGMLLFSAIDFMYFPCPYIWGSFCTGICFLYFAVKTKSSVFRIFSFNLTIFLFCFGIAETGTVLFTPTDQERTEGGYTQNYFIPDETLGYAPQKGLAVSSRRYHGNELVYAVTYTIDINGLRISPTFPSAECTGSVLFFGCSLTFGEGLNDHEAMPFLVGTLSQRKVYNFAFHGYGPHQMLSAIEHGVVDKTVDGDPQYAIYQTGLFHVARAAGYFFMGRSRSQICSFPKRGS